VVVCPLYSPGKRGNAQPKLALFRSARPFTDKIKRVIIFVARMSALGHSLPFFPCRYSLKNGRYTPESDHPSFLQFGSDGPKADKTNEAAN
jgi:hypothetical protein